MGLPAIPRDDARLQALYLNLDVLNKITQAVKEFISGVLLHCQLIMCLHRGTLGWLGVSLRIEPKDPSTGPKR